MINILLVEDEDNLANAILLNLELEGYQPHWLKNGKTAETTLIQKPNFYDLIILDVMIPEKDGLELCLFIRKRGITTPVLFLSARNSTSDKVAGLKAGGNDYLGKPFDLEEFILRVKNLLSIKLPSKQEHFNFSGNTIYFDRFCAETASGGQIDFSKREISMLELFTNNVNKTLSREDLAESIVEKGDINYRIIDNALVKFRKAFEPNPSKPHHFISIRGVGYLFRL